MSDNAYNLDAIQRWMQTVIMHSGDILRGIGCDEARRFLDVGSDGVEKVVTRSKALTANERLAIYSRAYRARLLECLRAEFPVLLIALGDDLFNRFAVDYLENYPSQTYTLAHLGQLFPRYLRETRPGRDASEHTREKWPDFIIDLATLEREFSEVFDGQGVEGHQIVTGDRLQEVLQSTNWANVRLVAAPCLRLLRFSFPVNTYFVAARKQENPDFPEAADTFLAITRRDYDVFLYELSRQRYELLSALIRGESVAQTITIASRITRSNHDQLTDDVSACLIDWAVAGFFLAIDLIARIHGE